MNLIAGRCLFAVLLSVVLPAVQLHCAGLLSMQHQRQQAAVVPAM